MKNSITRKSVDIDFSYDDSNKYQIVSDKYFYNLYNQGQNNCNADNFMNLLNIKFQKNYK